MAEIFAEPAYGVLGSVIRLSGERSADPDALPLTYAWRFVSVPIGSVVAQEGFRSLDPSGGLVSFSPDVVGEYVVGLRVNNGVLTSEEATSRVSIRALMVPVGRGIVPDGKFIWKYIRDVWQSVEGSEVFESLWSILIQAVGAEMMKLYQNDFNRSIRDIQDLYQRRWLCYEPRLSLKPDGLSFFLGNTSAGTAATTQDPTAVGSGILLSDTEITVVLGSVLPDALNATLTITADPRNAGNLGDYRVQGVNLSRTGYKLQTSVDHSQSTILRDVRFTFGFQSSSWVLVENIPGDADAVLVGDVVHIPSGPNAGFFRITGKNGTAVQVDKTPQAASDATLTAVLRPVEFRLTPANGLPETRSSFSIPSSEGSSVVNLAPGRIIAAGGRAYTILRAFSAPQLPVPMTVVVTDGGEVPVVAGSMNWRAPNTLVSESLDFEEQGVSAGDVFEVDIVNERSMAICTLGLLVVAVDRNRLGFVLTDEGLTAGAVPGVPDAFYRKLAETFGISGVVTNEDGSMTLTSDALALDQVIKSGIFQRKYWNQELTPETPFELLGGTFYVRPKAVIRNRKVPVDAELRSIPVLQNWLTTPNLVEKDGKLLQVLGDRTFDVKSPPMRLIENSDFVIDAEVAFAGQARFRTGTAILTLEYGYFVDRGIGPGDFFEIEAPSSLAGRYRIVSVSSNTEVRLSRAIPSYALGEFVTAEVRLLRRSSGRFLRFVPGSFSAKSPAPDRLWAEVSFFDNAQAIEDNFGILVSLNRADLESISSDTNYRQAVAGLMFAYTNGPIIDKIRLGAQILLGLPFTEHRGIIRSIEEDYRLDTDGDPVLGRLLVEDVDSSDAPLGTMRVYTFPIDSVSVLAGLDINPATGATYEVGDTVERFASLCKGVEVNDYLTRAEAQTAIARLQQFHTLRLRVNDNLFSTEELRLVSSFLKRITPSYVSMMMRIMSEFADRVPVEDRPTLHFRNGLNTLVDDAFTLSSTPLIFDARTLSGYNFIIDETVPSLRVFGRDLRTGLNGKGGAISASGGFVDSNGVAPVVKAGDLLHILEGANQGIYPVVAVINDGALAVSGYPAEGLAVASNQVFAILRNPSHEVYSATSIEAESGDLLMPGSVLASGLTVGDQVVVDRGQGGVTRHTVINVTSAGEGWPGQGRAVLLPSLVEEDLTGASTKAYRPSLMGLAYNDGFSITSTGASYQSPDNPFLWAMVEPGDVLEVETGESLQVIDPTVFDLRPVLAAGDYVVRLRKQGVAGGSLSWGFREQVPLELIDVGLSESEALAACTLSSVEVSLSMQRTSDTPENPARAPEAVNPKDLGVRPGDFLALTGGANSLVDVGYGPGVYLIAQVSSTLVTLETALSSGESSGWKIFRRIR